MINYGFCNIIKTNNHDSDILYLRCKTPLFEFNIKDNNTAQVFQSKNIKATGTSTIPVNFVRLVVTPRVSFVIPISTCTEGLKRFKHQFRPKPQQTALVKKLYPHFLQSKTSPGHFLVFWAMGSGKTKGILNCLRYVEKEVLNHIIVVCPKSCVLNWADEIGSLAFLEDETKDRSFIFTILCESQLKARLQENELFFQDKIVIYDEVQTLRNLTPDQQWIIRALQHAYAKILLTGTPVVNSEDEINYLRFIAGDTKTPFKTLYKNRVHFYDPQDSSVLDSRPPDLVPMTWYQTFKYFECSSSIIKIGGITIQTSTHNSYDILQKIKSIYVEDDHCPKIDALIDNIRTFNKFPQVIHSRFIESGLERIKSKLLKAFPNRRIEIFHGSLSNEDRANILSNYNAYRIDVLLISNAGSLGINLRWTQVFHNLEPFDNKSSRNQTIARCLRMDSYTSTPPRPGLNTFLTEITYISVLPSLQSLNMNSFDLVFKVKEPFYVKQFPNTQTRQKAVYDYLKHQILNNNFQTVDEKIHSRMNEKQKSIDKVLTELKLMGKDPYLERLLEKQQARQAYRAKSKARKLGQNVDESQNLAKDLEQLSLQNNKVKSQPKRQKKTPLQADQNLNKNLDKNNKVKKSKQIH